MVLLRAKPVILKTLISTKTFNTHYVEKGIPKLLKEMWKDNPPNKPISIVDVYSQRIDRCDSCINPNVKPPDIVVKCTN